MKNKMKSVILGLLLAVLISVPSFAALVDQPIESIEGEVIVKENDRIVVQLYDRRGNWIADGILEINNPRNGRIGIYMETQCHVSVDEIEMSVAVDKQISANSWQQVDYLTYTFTAKSNEELTGAYIDLQLAGHESNTVYRLRGIHAAILNGSGETISTSTPGLLITNN